MVVEVLKRLIFCSNAVYGVLQCAAFGVAAWLYSFFFCIYCAYTYSGLWIYA